MIRKSFCAHDISLKESCKKVSLLLSTLKEVVESILNDNDVVEMQLVSML